MTGRDVEKVMAGIDTKTISQMLSFKGCRSTAALFFVQVSHVWLKKLSPTSKKNVIMNMINRYEYTSSARCAQIVSVEP
jgi:hypothetical protein